MASDGTFGGDHSVQWEVRADNLRPGSLTEGPWNGNAGRHHKGVDNSDPADPYFTVTIKFPRDSVQRDSLLTSLREQVASPGAALTFRLPIEDEANGGANTDQIKISWPSVPITAGGARQR
jgi:hypothetical protein